MKILKKKDFLFQNISIIKGVGKKIENYLKGKNIEKISDLLLHLPYTFTDRSKIIKTDELEIGSIATLRVKVIKYNFPRKRNLPNTIICEDQYGRINLVYFNTNEFYLRKILKINSNIVVSGKVNFYKNKYQITNPDYIADDKNINIFDKAIPKYSLTEGLKDKTYKKIINNVLKMVPDLDEWIDKKTVEKENFLKWRDTLSKLHETNDNQLIKKLKRRLAYDEILANIIILSKDRFFSKRKKKNKKIFNKENENLIKKNLEYSLTGDQVKVINEINADLQSNNRMFRILQGDVGSGKTIVSLITAANIIKSGYQCALMAPTEILAKQHFNSSLKLFRNLDIRVEFLSSNTISKQKKIIIDKMKNGEIDFIIGTHSLFQKKVIFKKLGFVIIDEQHKFGVKQRMRLSKKGGDDCDILLMSATPIPRTMILSVYGDIDVSKLIEKPNKRKDIVTYGKYEKNLNQIINLIKKETILNNQIFWVCPLIEESKILKFSSTKTRYEYLKKIFKNDVGILHGELSLSEKDKLLKDFANKKFKILVSTTVIEVGVDFPDANVIIIENAEKFGLAQLHQLRGRVGRGNKQGICVLVFKTNLTNKAAKRIRILKKINDGFEIAEQDLKLRGFGDILGFKQSGDKFFKFVDPNSDQDLFEKALTQVRGQIKNDGFFKKYETLLNLFDKAEISFNPESF